LVAALRGEMVGAEGHRGHFMEVRASWAGVPRKEARRESRRDGRGCCARKKESWRVGSLGQQQSGARARVKLGLRVLGRGAGPGDAGAGSAGPRGGKTSWAAERGKGAGRAG